MLTRSRGIERLGIGTLALLGLGTVTLQPTPAAAQVVVGVGLPGYAYVAPPPYYPYAYPAYYGYTPYHSNAYFGGGFYAGFGGGHNWHY